MDICSPDGSMMYLWEFSESGCLGSYEVKQNASSPVDFGNGTYAACHCSPQTGSYVHVKLYADSNCTISSPDGGFPDIVVGEAFSFTDSSEEEECQMWGLPSGTGVGTNSSSTSAAILYYSNAACPVREWDINQTIPSGQCVQVDEWTYAELAVKEYDGLSLIHI